MNVIEMLPEVGKLNRTIRTTTQNSAIIAIGLRPAAEAPDAMLSHSLVVSTEVDRDPVRGVQEDRADGRDDDDGGAAAGEEGHDRQDERADDHRDQRVGRRAVLVR